ncbi:darobactin family peptide antibiotic [Yersinia enterocolitica]|uniref:darobactin family peptide antibiotic n=1 Tax=Yersinia enterocolitica TaxID=630 RepID=UPI001C8D760D|nr:darobactin family peptide antibiotic [Yersinia enterocolitica]MBX9497327.1 darobactin family peptide antibiotic [Yersinia enterocolitica]
MFTSNQSNERINNAHLMALKAKLESLDESFKNNTLHISDGEIEKIKSNTLRSKITAWNWSRSFAEE